MKTESFVAKEYREVKARVNDLRREELELTATIEATHAKVQSAAERRTRNTLQAKFNDVCGKRAYIRSQLQAALCRLADAERNVIVEARNSVAAQFRGDVKAEFAAMIGG